MSSACRFIWKWLASHPWGFAAMSASFSLTFTITSLMLGSHKGLEKYFAISGAAFALAGVLSSLRHLARLGYTETFAPAELIAGARPFLLSTEDQVAVDESRSDLYAELFVGPVLVGVGTLLGGIGGFMG